VNTILKLVLVARVPLFTVSLTVLPMSSPPPVVVSVVVPVDPVVASVVATVVASVVDDVTASVVDASVEEPVASVVEVDAEVVGVSVVVPPDVVPVVPLDPDSVPTVVTVSSPQPCICGTATITTTRAHHARMRAVRCIGPHLPPRIY
jgi:hypothetical protein